MIPSWSDKHPKKRAQQIYSRAAWKIAAVGYIALFPLCIGISFLAEWLGVSTRGEWPLSVTMVFGFSTISLVSHSRGMDALKRSGLLREECEIIERVGAIAAGETIEFRKSVGSKLGGVAFMLVLCGFSAWLYMARPNEAAYRVIGIGGIVLFGLLTLAIVLSIRRPIFRVDDAGIFVCADWLIPRNVPWQRVHSAQIQRFWGLPPSYSVDANPAESVSLKDANGKTLLVLNAITFAEAPPEIKERFVAEIKRRLTGAEPTRTEK